MNGFIVTAGCQTLVFERSESLLKELGRYLDKPQEVEKEYLEKYGMIGQPLGGCDVEQALQPVTPYPPLYAAQEGAANCTTTGLYTLGKGQGVTAAVCHVDVT